MKDELNLESQIGITLDSWNDLYINSGVYSAIFSELVCVVCKYPKKINVNDSFNLHNTKGLAVEWGNSTDDTYFDCYYIQGRNVSKELFAKLQNDEYTLQDFIKESDEEVKSACIAFLQETKGDNFLVSFFRDNLKEVNSFVDKKEGKYLVGTTQSMNVGVYTLFKGDINGTNIAYVRCYCPSTDRMFFLGVSSEHNNAKDAIASLYRVPKKLKPFIKHINRQGERYSTNFTSDGLALLKRMKKEEVEDLVSISGSEYFDKIKYEF